MSTSTKQRIRRVPLVGPSLVVVANVVRRNTFPGSSRYWERRYARGGDSGEGSTGSLARVKADLINDFVRRQGIESVVEFGCGDGQQLALAQYPRYLGLDVSNTTLRKVLREYSNDQTKSFLLYDPFCFADPAQLVRADLALSLDVIYHLVEDDIYHLHLRHVFGAARRFVILYTSDAENLRVDEPVAAHVRHRPVVRDVAATFPAWRLLERVPNDRPYQGRNTGTSFADFLIYERSR